MPGTPKARSHWHTPFQQDRTFHNSPNSTTSRKPSTQVPEPGPGEGGHFSFKVPHELTRSSSGRRPHPPVTDTQQAHREGRQGSETTPKSSATEKTGEAGQRGPALARRSGLKFRTCCLENVFFLCVEGLDQVHLSLQAFAQHLPPKPTCTHV